MSNTKTEKKPKQETKPLDEKDYRDKMESILDQMLVKDNADEIIKECLKYLKITYGLKSTEIRLAAATIRKREREKLEEKNENVISYIEIYEAGQ